MKLGVNFFNDTRSGRLAAQLDENVSGIRDLLSLTLISITRDAVTLVGLVCLMVYQDPVLSLSSLLIGPPLIWAVVFITRRVRKINRESLLITSRLSGSVHEATQGIAIVKASPMEDELARRVGAMATPAEQRSIKFGRVSERLPPVSEMLGGLAVTAVIAYSGYRALVLGQPPGAVFSFITALILAYDPARRLARMQVTMERALVNARMIYELLDIVPKQGYAPDATEAHFTTG